MLGFCFFGVRLMGKALGIMPLLVLTGWWNSRPLCPFGVHFDCGMKTAVSEARDCIWRDEKYNILPSSSNIIIYILALTFSSEYITLRSIQSTKKNLIQRAHKSNEHARCCRTEIDGAASRIRCLSSLPHQLILPS